MYFQIENLKPLFMKAKEFRTCLFCGKVLSGRSDKKYCDDSCRNNHHYQIKREKDDDNQYFVKMINASLLQNRRILMLHNSRRSVIVKKQSLIDEHFDFELVTSVCKTKKGIEYRVVYDYAYKSLNEEEVLLFKYGR